MRRIQDAHADWQTRGALRRIGLPTGLLVDPHGTREKGLALIEEIKQLERRFSEWEATQPEHVLKLCPWYEAREEWKRLKAEGREPEIKWWEALHFLECGAPRRFTHKKGWGGAYRYPRPADSQKPRKNSKP